MSAHFTKSFEPIEREWSCNLSKKLSTSSNSQSFNCIINLGFQVPLSQTSTTQASLEEAIEKRSRKASRNNKSLHHLSFQNFTLFPDLTLKWVLTLKSSQPFLVAFQNPTPCLSITSFMHQPPSSCLYLQTITCFHRGFLLVTNLHDHSPKRALLKVPRFLNPNPPFTFFEQTTNQLNRWGLLTKAPPPQRKSLWIFYNLAATLLGMIKRDIQ